MGAIPRFKWTNFTFVSWFHDALKSHISESGGGSHRLRHDSLQISIRSGTCTCFETLFFRPWGHRQIKWQTSVYLRRTFELRVNRGQPWSRSDLEILRNFLKNEQSVPFSHWLKKPPKSSFCSYLGNELGKGSFRSLQMVIKLVRHGLIGWTCFFIL